MARYKNYNYEQTKLLPIRYCEQILPGTFEYALNDVIGKADLAVFDARYKNDATGAPAYDPRILLKIILFAYARGIFSSRRIESLCRENVIMMALSADTQPDFTTIAEFVSSASDEIVVLFREVLLIGDAMGLIGKELFAIDGCKLASNASKEWSGTKADLAKKHRKLTRAIRVMLARHRQQDAHEASGEVSDQERQYLATLRARAQKIRQFLATHPENVSPTGTIRQSNGANVTIRGFVGVKFTAPKSACAPCGLRDRCLRHPARTKVRQVVFFTGHTRQAGETFTNKMKRKIDSAAGRLIYQRRLATAEPPFANIRHAKGLDRFTLRGKTKVDAQWLLYCLVHNIGKIQRYGPASA